MGWPVILTPQSQDDLREIVSFIARDSPQRALAFGNLLVDTALSLATQPERGRVVPEQDDPAVREIIRGAYRIIYEVVREPSAVFVLRFWHGARGEPEIANV
ncbi:MAG: type II toxin-antitoxin system RelE/ParE family toxin [Verrucomicrobiota bacterium]|nr:type II toxin-antitoxin system RelE/ParE family toxin [Verrucomicrobiota bacterium]MDQ2924975.1 type II toxin-antitoxin system RelE/ParE family toxin [Acidobacteriota bacterium]